MSGVAWRGAETGGKRPGADAGGCVSAAEQGKVIDMLDNSSFQKNTTARMNRTYSSKPDSLLLSFFFSLLVIGGSTIGSESGLVFAGGLSFCVGT